MVTYLIFTVIVALLAAFAILLIDKLGIREWVQIHGLKFFSEMFGCGFCLSFWAGCLFAIILAMVTWNPVLLAVPFCSTPLTRIMI